MKKRDVEEIEALDMEAMSRPEATRRRVASLRLLAQDLNATGSMNDEDFKEVNEDLSEVEKRLGKSN